MRHPAGTNEQGSALSQTYDVNKVITGSCSLLFPTQPFYGRRSKAEHTNEKGFDPRISEHPRISEPSNSVSAFAMDHAMPSLILDGPRYSIRPTGWLRFDVRPYQKQLCPTNRRFEKNMKHGYPTMDDADTHVWGQRDMSINTTRLRE